MATDAEILDALKTALYAIAVRGAKSYTIGDRTFTSLDLKELREQIAYYENKAAAAAGTNRPGVVRFRNPG